MKHNDAMAIIAAGLINARKDRQLTQTQLAERLAIPQSYISRLESCRLDSRVSTVKEIANYLGLELLLIPSNMVAKVRLLIDGPSDDFAKPLYRLDEDEEQSDED